MKKIIFLILILTALLFACKKNTNYNDWTEQDQIYYDNMIALQDQAAENYMTWLQTMDSLEVINQLQQFFLDDSSVTSATIGSQGIAVQYLNGMRGGIFLNPEDYPGGDTLKMEPLPIMPSSNLDEKSIVNRKKAIFLNPHYWDREVYANWIVASDNYWMPKAGFHLDKEAHNEFAHVSAFAQLSGYGIIHIYSHGWAWPKETNIADVYLMTGEIVNDITSKAYQEEIKNGNILIGKAKTSISQLSNVYWITEKFIADHNDFSKDTVLFYGGFCYSFLGEWPEIEKTFAKGAYFGFDWWVYTNWNASWAVALSDSLCDTSAVAPYNPEKWIVGPIIPKSYWCGKANKTVHIWYTGDATLTLWKDSTAIETSPITDITGTTAIGGGNVISDGGNPVTTRGICWSTSSHPTIADSYTTDGSGTGVFVSNITGLTPTTPNYVRAYATNNMGVTTYGNQLSFTTSIDEFSIGQSYGGGIIFYIDGTGKHGLISTNSYQASYVPWGCEGTLIGVTSTLFGTGQANTTAIVNACSEAGIAARICDDLVEEGYSDWFLPSKEELDQMYLQRNFIGNFADHTYWSSSEVDVEDAWSRRFLDGISLNDGKQYGNRVRAIRAF